MKKTVLFIVLIFVGACATAAGTDLSLEEKKQAVIKFMQQHTFKPGTFKDPRLCEPFFEDFKRQTNIEYVKPLVVAHDYFDPQLQKYLKRCPKMELRTPVSGRSGGYVGTPSLKLYQVDIDNNQENGEEYFYFEGAFWRKATISGEHITDGTSYRLLDVEHCTTRGQRLSVGASRIYGLDTDFSARRPDTSHHDVIKYRGKYYVYDLIPAQGYSRPFALYGYSRERTKFLPICSFTR